MQCLDGQVQRRFCILAQRLEIGSNNKLGALCSSGKAAVNGLVKCTGFVVDIQCEERLVKLYPLGTSRGELTQYFFRSEAHTSELQSLMRTSYAVFCLKKKKHKNIINT